MDSPVALLQAAHCPALPARLQTHNHLLKQQLNLLLAALTQQKEHNLNLLRQIDRQEDSIAALRVEVDQTERRQHEQLLPAASQQLQEHPLPSSLSDRKHAFKSMEIPHKRAYLDANNRSIEASFEQKGGRAGRGGEGRGGRGGYGGLYRGGCFSVSKLRLK